MLSFALRTATPFLYMSDAYKSPAIPAPPATFNAPVVVLVAAVVAVTFARVLIVAVPMLATVRLPRLVMFGCAAVSIVPAMFVNASLGLYQVLVDLVELVAVDVVLRVDKLAKLVVLVVIGQPQVQTLTTVEMVAVELEQSLGLITASQVQLTLQL